MALDIDFGDGVKDTGEQTNNTNKSSDEQLANKEADAATINGDKGTPDITSKSGDATTENNGGNNASNSSDSKEEKEDQHDESASSQLTAGTEIEYEGQTYKVAENGDIVDKNGTVFKAAAQVKEWLETVQKEDDVKDEKEDTFDIKKLQDEIGIEVTGEDGKPIEFENSIAGVKAYVDSIMDIKSTEIADATINRFMEANPIIPQFIDYCKVNGSPVGFGQIPDRSNIELNKDNEAQLEAVIRMAAKEFGNASLNDNYIKYLKDSGGLFDEAQVQLKNLVAKDKQYIENMQKEAAAQREQEQKNLAGYWENVNKIIDSRTIAGFKIPESFTKEQNGKKLIYTPNDFFNYLSRNNIADENGNKITAYERDLNNMSEEELIQRDLLAAWLMFTGGTYKDLANMSIQENKVNQLRLKSKEQRAVKPIKFVSKSAKKADINDILL